MGVKPPGVKDNWEDMNVTDQAKLLAFEQVRSYDESKRFEVQ